MVPKGPKSWKRVNTVVDQPPLPREACSVYQEGLQGMVEFVS